MISWRINRNKSNHKNSQALICFFLKKTIKKDIRGLKYEQKNKIRSMRLLSCPARIQSFTNILQYFSETLSVDEVKFIYAFLELALLKIMIIKAHHCQFIVCLLVVFCLFVFWGKQHMEKDIASKYLWKLEMPEYSLGFIPHDTMEKDIFSDPF